MFDPHSPFAATRGLQPSGPAPGSKQALALARLREAILSCEVAPGEILHEQALAQRFGLGRAATRAALIELSAQGQVEAIARSGWRVRPLSPKQCGQLIEARRQLEPALLNQRPGAATLRELRRLAEILDALDGQTAPAAQMTARSHGRAFLNGLAAGANPWVATWLGAVWDESERVTSYLESHSDARLAPRRRGPLLTALEADDIATARAEIAQDLDAFQTFVGNGLMTLRIELGAQSAAAGNRRKTATSNEGDETRTRRVSQNDAPPSNRRELRHEDSS